MLVSSKIIEFRIGIELLINDMFIGSFPRVKIIEFEKGKSPT